MASSQHSFARQFLGVACFILFLSAGAAFAQTSIFTYQGRLTDGGTPANGPYDMEFKLYDALTLGNLQGSPNTVTRSGVTVTNGTFTVQLDFGATAFPGADRYLDIGVKHPADASYTPLAPRQQLTSTPYAIRASSATTATTATDNVLKGGDTMTGELVLSGNPTSSLGAATKQYVDGSVASKLNLSGGTLTGPLAMSNNQITGLANPTAGTDAANKNYVDAAVSGSSGGFTWQVVSGTFQLAQPNNGYVVTNAGQVEIALPESPATGAIVRITGAGLGGFKVSQNPGQRILLPQLKLGLQSWQAVASSSDGTKLVAVVRGGQIYTSTNSGNLWTARESNRNWWAVASSDDGTKLVAVVQGGQIYTSTDSGLTWTPGESNRAWVAVASSASGSHLVAAVTGGSIYTSTNSGLFWTPRTDNRAWRGLASSADSTRKFAAPYVGQIHRSISASGVDWTPWGPEANWVSVATSSDGAKVVAVANPGQIYTSDGGVDWTPRAHEENWISVASSADGTKLVAVTEAHQIYTSTDSGISWTARESNRQWRSVASSADGTKLVAVVDNGQIYLSTDSGVTWSVAMQGTTTGTGFLTGEHLAAVELQYIGGGQFLVISHEGSLVPN